MAKIMKAILSDIHGNLEALRAVLVDISGHDIEAIYCLGDIVGYGPNPRECLDIAMHWNAVLLGNMDLAGTCDPTDVGPSASAASRSLVWSRRELNVPVPDQESAGRRWKFLAERPRVHREGNFLLVHGSARNPLHEYVFPEDVYNPRKTERIFALVERYCFQGHTHVPGIFIEQSPGEVYQFIRPEETEYTYRLDVRKTLCNVGSVGQPRDGDWRACYVLLDEEAVRFRRVEYDIETTIRKIKDIDDWLGDRLDDGP
jgi:diadenosine tetraphosphatase ApaH/serine/threonine PP2A family protein phosphatase